MNASTEKITNNYKWLQFTKMQLDKVNYYTHFPHSFQQLLKKNGNACWALPWLLRKRVKLKIIIE